MSSAEEIIQAYDDFVEKHEILPDVIYVNAKTFYDVIMPNTTNWQFGDNQPKVMGCSVIIAHDMPEDFLWLKDYWVKTASKNWDERQLSVKIKVAKILSTASFVDRSTSPVKRRSLSDDCWEMEISARIVQAYRKNLHNAS